MTLKEKMEAQWEARGVKFPLHLCRWSEQSKYNNTLSAQRGTVMPNKIKGSRLFRRKRRDWS